MDPACKKLMTESWGCVYVLQILNLTELMRGNENFPAVNPFPIK